MSPGWHQWVYHATLVIDYLEKAKYGAYDFSRTTKVNIFLKKNVILLLESRFAI